MRQFRTILGYELKKICYRKSTWITCVALVFVFLLSVALTWSKSYAYMAETREDNSGLVESEEWHDSFVQKKERERKNGLCQSGKKIDDALLLETIAEYGTVMDKIEQMEKSGKRGLQEYFSKEMERFAPIGNTLSALTGESVDRVIEQAVAQKEEDRLTMQKIYEARDNQIQKYQGQFGLTEKERGYWEEKEKLVDKPFTYQYAEGFFRLISMDGIYMVILLGSFLLAVVVSRIFAEEHQCRLDQIILCSRYGKGELYFAKVTAGILFALFATLIMAGVIIATNFICYGTEGFGAAVQLIAGWYSYPLTVGKTLLIMLGICVLAALFTSMFIMVVSEKFCSGMAGMAAGILIIIAPRIIVIPREFRMLSQVWNYFPINMLKMDSGFLDIRLVSIMGAKFTSWQFAPVLYVVLGILLVFLGKRCYCRYQVLGR